MNKFMFLSTVRLLWTATTARILEVLSTNWLWNNSSIVITSAADGTHSGPTDPHFSGFAIDVRSRDIPTLEAKRIQQQHLQNSLGAQFQVLLEPYDTGSSVAEHFHIALRPEYRPRLATTGEVNDRSNSLPTV